MAVKKKFALGRGLDALISTETVSTGGSSTINEIDVNLIEANPNQPRREFDEDALQELADSIEEIGIVQPITLRALDNGRYQIIAGERRWRASMKVGLQSIPAYIRTADDENVMEMALIENIHRENLNAIEVAISYQRLLEECQLTQDQLSEKVGKDRSTVANFLRLLKLPAEIQIAIRDGFITMGHARAIINIDDKAKQLVILKKIIDDDLSVRQVEILVRDINNEGERKTVKKQKNTLPESYKIQAQTLSKALNMGVKVSRDSKGKGSLTINFKNDQEFERLLDFINKGN